MEQSDQSLMHLVRTLNRFVEQESTQWKPLVPVDSQMECFQQRSEIIEWLTLVCHEFGFCDETLFHAVDIFDRFLRRIKAATKYLRCIGIACLYLAAKLNEEDEVIPVTEDMVGKSRCGCSEAEVLRMERCILDKLNWALIGSPTPIQFIHLFDALIRTKCPSLNDSFPDSVLGRFILCRALKRCLPRIDLVQCSPSTVALSLLSLYLQMTWIYWRQAVDTLQAYARISDDKLAECNHLMESLVGRYLRDTVLRCSRGVLAEHNGNNNAAQQLPPPIQHQEEESLMKSLTVTSSSSSSLSRTSIEPPRSNPVSPDPPAKRRKIELDDDVYSDIRNLYEAPSAELAKVVFVPRFREVTPFVTYAAVVRSTCASEVRDCANALNASFQQIAST